MTTAREIADWHRAEAQRLKDERVEPEVSYREGLYPITASFAHVFSNQDRIKLHERFAAWLEKA